MQNARRIGADIDAGADLAERPRLLVDVHIEARLEQAQGRAEAADAAADDRDGSVGAHRAIIWSGFDHYMNLSAI